MDEIMIDLKKANEAVNHPAHYAENCSIECIEAMEMVFEPSELIAGCKVNAFKYLWRYKAKNGREDLEKMKWYIDKAYDLYAKYDHLTRDNDRLLYTLYSFCNEKFGLTETKGKHEGKKEEVNDGLS